MSKTSIICQFCGTIRYVKPSALHSAKFCCRKCKDDAGQTKVTRDKISKSLTGYKQTKEHILKYSGKNHGMYGKGYKLAGSNHYRWKGGKYQKDERWFIYIDGIRYKQSRYIAEQFLNRKLTKHEIIHHINGDKTDDRTENLYLFPSQSEHITQHNLKNPPFLISNLI